MNASRKPKTLQNSQQFRRVYDMGQRFNTPFFSAFILMTESGESRCGFTVTRKIGGAVIRNRCKRRLREVVRKYYSNPHAEAEHTPGCDFVLNAKSSLLTADFKQIEESFTKVMGHFYKSVETTKDTK